MEDIRESRIQAFETYDKPIMKPIPNDNFTLCDCKRISSVPEIAISDMITTTIP
ncbi:MAG: hypothetical protein LUE27_02205 [Clostridia bacterium]|nr:hypothetical protein [Clostridia bacterium]